MIQARFYFSPDDVTSGTDVADPQTATDTATQTDTTATQDGSTAPAGQPGPAQDSSASAGSGGSSSAPVSFNVPLLPQPTKDSCWAASMAMIINYNRQQSGVTPASVATEVGQDLRTCYSWDLLQAARDHFGFQSVIQAPADTCLSYPPQQWKDWLTQYGPLWYTFIWAEGGSHAMVLTGISGDMTPDGTTFQIQNPWDVNTKFDNDATDFHPDNNGCSQTMAYNNFSQVFGDLGYDVSHAGYRIMYLPAGS